MNITNLVLLSLILGQTDAPRPRHPLAPSLPQLTPKEEARYEAILHRFIQYDTGKLPGAPGKKALEDFNQLPPEAIFVLIDGFNQAANMEASCPAVLIGKKIMKILNSSDDLELLTFAKETLGAGVTAKRHLGMLKDVQFSILLRKGVVQQRRLAVGGTSGAGASPKALGSLARADLAKHMTRQTGSQLKDLLRHERLEVKAAAAKEIGKRGLPYGSELIALLESSEPPLHQAARTALGQISGGLDYGPEPDASFADRETARRRWRDWWAKQNR